MKSHLIKAISAQTTGFLGIYALGHSPLLPALSLTALAVVQAIIATATAAFLRSPRWWLVIHLAFAPALALAISAKLPAWPYGLAFVLLALVYWSSFRTQVPLFLSNRITVYRLAAWLPSDNTLRVLDAGSGTGSFAHRLARLRPDWRITGIEAAPAPWLLSRRLGRSQTNLTFRRGDLWAEPFAGYDLVYAFLSPVPMSELWRKARREMRPGSLLVSNSFPIEGLTAEKQIHVDDRRSTRLYVYRIPGRANLNG